MVHSMRWVKWWLPSVHGPLLATVTCWHVAEISAACDGVSLGAWLRRATYLPAGGQLQMFWLMTKNLLCVLLVCYCIR